MTHRLAAILALIALSGIVANAATISPSLSTSLFNSTPISVFNIADTDDVAFDDRMAVGVHFVAGTINTTIYIYSVNWVDSSTGITVVRRSLNATAVASGTAENLIDDATLTTTVKAASAPSFYAGGIGYFGFATGVVESTIPKLYVNILSGTSTSPSSVEITGNTDDAATLTMFALIHEDNCFYVVYTVTDSTTSSDDGLYIQAVNATDSSKLYTAASQLITLTDSVSELTAGATNTTNSTLLLLTYKIDDKVYVAQVTRSTGALSGTASTLYTDVTQSGSTNGLTYTPAGVFGSESTYGTGVKVVEDDGSDEWTSVVVFYNGTTNSPTNISANFTLPTNYLARGIGGMNYIDGYSICLVSADSVSTGLPSYAVVNYYPNGTVNGTQLTIGTVATASIFADGNGTVWFGTVSYDDSDDTAVQGYLGKLVGQIYASGNIVASFFALLSLLIAALFTF